MGATYRFISDPSLPNPVERWFEALDGAPEKVEGEKGVWLYFRSMGALARDIDGSIDAQRSPLVSLFPPAVRRGVIWTVGEVHFISTPLRESFPKLHVVSTRLRKWLQSFECVYSNKTGRPNKWDYYLEGSVKNYDPPVYALDGGLEALRRGQYFVAEGDTDSMLDKLYGLLRLRDVHCKQEA